MAHTTLLCWDVDCATDGVQNVWAAEGAPPTECPLDAGHTVNSVNPTADFYNDGQPVAHSKIYMNDDNGRVYRMEIDQNGAWVATQIAGPAPS